MAICELQIMFVEEVRRLIKQMKVFGRRERKKRRWIEEGEQCVGFVWEKR